MNELILELEPLFLFKSFHFHHINLINIENITHFSKLIDLPIFKIIFYLFKFKCVIHF